MQLYIVRVVNGERLAKNVKMVRNLRQALTGTSKRGKNGLFTSCPARVTIRKVVSALSAYHRSDGILTDCLIGGLFFLFLERVWQAEKGMQ